MSKIRDIPRYRDVARQADSLAALRELWPALHSLGVVEKHPPVSAEEIARLKARAEELINLPDRFNDAFASRGWVAYESLNTEVMKEAIALAESGQPEEGESRILKYYLTEDKVRCHLRIMYGVKAWGIRAALAEMAMEDYLAARYHASVPVVLALIDGLVSDVATTGFFAEGTDMSAWDSVAGHSSGLGTICAIFNRGRRKSTTETIYQPFRHGILHGRDLGYANEIVAAKTWATLFAIRDWAIKVENQTSEPPPHTRVETFQESLSGLMDSIEKIERNRQVQRDLDSWRARDLSGMSLSTDDFEETSPERVAADVLQSWKAANYGGIATHISARSGEETVRKRAGRIRSRIEPKRIDFFNILEIRDEAPAITAVVVRVTGQASYSIKQEDFYHEFRMVFEDNKGTATVRGTTGGAWRVIEASLFAPRPRKTLPQRSQNQANREDG